MRRFFITGYPRSRTAWAANWLTTPTGICYHDPKSGQTPILMEKTGAWAYCGASGSEVAEDWKELAKDYPDAKWAILYRDPEESLRSFLYTTERTGNTVPVWALQRLWERRTHQLQEIAELPQTMKLKPEYMNIESYAKKLFMHLLPEQEFCVERWRLLTSFNVQQDIQWRLAH